MKGNGSGKNSLEGGGIMLRGCQKQMIVLQTPESSLFESAFLVLRREMGEVGQDDMVAEASRIVGGAPRLRRRGRRRGPWLTPFLSGVLLGGGVAFICFLLII